MISVIEHIQYLVSRYDCVVVPSLGAFIASSEEARIDSSDRMTPPRRTLSFNGNIVREDGLLAQSVARREGLSYEQARQEVSHAVELLRCRLTAERRIDLPRIGQLTLNEEDSIGFTPDDSETAVVDMAYAGLPVLQLQRVVEVEEPESVVIPVEYRPRRRWRAVAGYAAAVALLLGLGITLTTPIVVDQRTVVKASTAPTITAPKAATVETVVAEPVAEPTVTPVENKTAEPSVAKTVVEDKSGLPAGMMTADKFEQTHPEGYDCYLIVASCASRSEANRFIRQQKDGDKLRVVKSDGRYRVYMAVANDYDVAFRYKSTDAGMRSNHPQAWVYKASK